LGFAIGEISVCRPVPRIALQWPDFRQDPPSQRLHFRRPGGLMFAIPALLATDSLRDTSEKLDVSLFDSFQIFGASSEPAMRLAVA
jgi:hypothetical protein